MHAFQADIWMIFPATYAWFSGWIMHDFQIDLRMIFRPTYAWFLDWLICMIIRLTYMHDFQVALRMIFRPTFAWFFRLTYAWFFWLTYAWFSTHVWLSTIDGKGRNLDPANDIHTNSLDIMGLHFNQGICKNLFVHLHILHLYPLLLIKRKFYISWIQIRIPSIFLFRCSSASRLVYDLFTVINNLFLFIPIFLMKGPRAGYRRIER